MAKGTRFFDFRATVPETHLYDLMNSCSGKAYNVTVTAVAAPDTGPAEAPAVRHRNKQSMRVWMSHWLTEQSSFDTATVRAAAQAAGYHPTSVYGALTTAIKDKTIKRTGPGEYARTGKAAPDVKLGRPIIKSKSPVKGRPKSKPGESMRDQVIAILKGANGTPMPLGTLKERLAANGFNTTGVSPTMTQLLGKKLIKRPEPGFYQITSKGENTEPSSAANGAQA
jgi:hypothetical protein